MADAATVDTVVAGDHACLMFSDPQERLDLVAAFVRDGLRLGQRVLCYTDSITPDRLAAELAARSVRGGAAIRRGQLLLADIEKSLLADRGDAAAMVAALSEEVSRAGAAGYRGLRITADMCWATRPLSPAQELVAFETKLAALLNDGQLSLICQYDRGRFDAVTLAFAAETHTKQVAAQAYHESPLLRICRQYRPPGIRVAGELDFRHRDVLENALAETVRLDRHPVANLAGLSYIDAACAAAFVRAATGLPPSRRMTVSCGRLVATVLGLAGADSLPRLCVTRVDA